MGYQIKTEDFDAVLKDLSQNYRGKNSTCLNF